MVKMQWEREDARFMGVSEVVRLVSPRKSRLSACSSGLACREEGARSESCGASTHVRMATSRRCWQMRPDAQSQPRDAQSQPRDAS